MSHCQYLDRKQVIDLYEKFHPSLATHVYEFGEALRKLPVTQDSHGEWIYNQYDGNRNIGNWHCSECRHIIFGGYSQKPYYNFCPNCGSDNRKRGEAE